MSVDHSSSFDHESDGKTSSERYLSQLGRKSFLSLWSYSNLYTDEGRKNGKGDGKELADLLVVFDKHVLIFSDKHCEFTQNIDLGVAWPRWYKRAVEKSVRQLLGAKRWLERYPNRIFLNKACTKPFPLPLPSQHDVRFHFLAVTRGSYKACCDHFAGQSTGSLMLNSNICGHEHHKNPFTIGHVLSDGPYVHVLDELTLEVLLCEFDTIVDFVDYLSRKESLLSHPTRKIMASGEEQLVAMYLTQIDDTGHHNFAEIPNNVDGVYVGEGHWESFIQNPQYKSKKQANVPSYAWDRLIEHFVKFGEIKADEDRNQLVSDLEPALRVLASETRLARRQLAGQLLDALNKQVKPGQRFLRVGYSKASPTTAYVFLVLPRPTFVETYEEYRQGRRALLLAACKVAKLRITSAQIIVGIATEPGGTKGASEDLVLLDVSDKEWGHTQEEEARHLQAEAGILHNQNVYSYEHKGQEYPDVPRMPKATSPAKRLLERSRLRRLEAMKEKHKDKL